mmetsp:Transcript_21101/g.44335  ORF Transcript_21101/g.44335 Transcript_21101/m.44335 type:complete len:356 (+) Transcript_21101:865-1932(+)
MAGDRRSQTVHPRAQHRRRRRRFQGIVVQADPATGQEEEPRSRIVVFLPGGSRPGRRQGRFLDHPRRGLCDAVERRGRESHGGTHDFHRRQPSTGGSMETRRRLFHHRLRAADERKQGGRDMEDNSGIPVGHRGQEEEPRLEIGIPVPRPAGGGSPDPVLAALRGRGRPGTLGGPAAALVQHARQRDAPEERVEQARSAGGRPGGEGIRPFLRQRPLVPALPQVHADARQLVQDGREALRRGGLLVGRPRRGRLQELLRGVPPVDGHRLRRRHPGAADGGAAGPGDPPFGGGERSDRKHRGEQRRWQAIGPEPVAEIGEIVLLDRTTIVSRAVADGLLGSWIVLWYGTIAVNHHN